MTTHRKTPSIMLIGPGTLFLSGISHYVARLAAALNEQGPVSLLLMRRLCPRFLYPGKARVGKAVTNITYPQTAPRFDGVDWFWGRTIVRAIRFLLSEKPDVVVLQWWTGTVAHTYLLLALIARRRGAKIILEMHEVLDVGEASIPFVGKYVTSLMRRIVNHVDGVVVHSSFDADAVAQAYQLPATLPVAVIMHGPYDHYEPTDTAASSDTAAGVGTMRLLYAGVVRPYKGLEELAAAMKIALDAGEDVHLTVVGEVWQGYRAPIDMLEQLPADRVTIVEGYVSDEEFATQFANADAVVLPYRRSSASGPLHVAMSRGLPVLTTAVGGLTEAAQGYSGAVLVPPCDAGELAEGIRKLRPLIGRPHVDPHSWDANADKFHALIDTIVKG